MIKVTFEVYHDEVKEGLEPFFTLETSLNHVPRIGEKVYFPEVYEELIRLNLEAKAFLVVSDVVNSILVVNDIESKNLVTCNLEVLS